MATTNERIAQRLQQILQPSTLRISDEGHLHVGHANAGRGHFAVTIASPLFKGKNLLLCHKLIYEALGDLMQTEVHALKITVLADD